MMLKFYIVTISASLALAACGSKKETSSNPKKDPKAQSGQFSYNDYPYIESFHNGVRLKTVGDVDGAIEAFTRCLSIRQNDDAAYFALAELELKKGDKNLALEHFIKASELDPKNIWYTEEIAYLHYENKEFDKATGDFKKLVDYEPKNLSWLYGYSDCLVRTGKTMESISILNKAEDVMGVTPELSIEKYNMFMFLKKESDALNEISKARTLYPNDPQLIATLVDHYFEKGDAPKAIQFLEELVQSDPENGRARMALGDVYRNQGKIDKSFDEFEKAFTCADVDVDAKMKLLITLQEASYKPENRAVQLMELMNKQHPNDAKSHAIRGDYMVALEKPKDAIYSYRKATEFDANQYPIWNQLLILEYQNELFEELYVDSKKCLENFTAMPTIYLLNGIGAIQMKKYEEAISSLEMGKSLLVNDKTMEAEFYGQLGDAYMSSKNYAEGKANFENAIKIDPRSNLLKNNYAYKLAVSKIELDKALSLINQAIENSSGQPSYLDTKGFILFQQNKFDEAAKLFEEAIQLDANQPDIYDHLGDAYYKLNDQTKALQNWNKAKELGSKNKSLSKKINEKTYYEASFD